MKKFVILLALLLVLFGLGACSSNSEQNIDKEQGMEKTQDKEKLSQDGQKKDTENKPLTKEDLKIGEIHIGDTLKKVKEIYGEPSEKTIVHGQGDPQWNYETQGLSVYGETIWVIRVFDSFKGSTPRGVKLGSTTEELKKSLSRCL